MNIAFFGTSDRSIPVLEGLKNSSFNLMLCVTKNDLPAGRRQELKPTAVKTWAETNRVQCLTIDKLNPETTSHIKDMLLSENVGLCVVADFSFLIPEVLLNIPPYKFVNIHFSLLPSYRGASPVQFAILNGDKKTGITYLLVSKGMDKGDVIFQSEYKLNGTETTNSLYKTLFEKAGKELPEVLEKYISGELKLIPQNENDATYTYSLSHPKNTLIFKEDAQIDWTKSLEEIERAVRAYNPWPIAWTKLSDLNSHYCGIKPDKDLVLRVKILEAGIDQNGKLIIKKLQIEGKNAVSWNEFENGYVVKG